MIEEDNSSSRLVLQETLIALANARDELDRVLREECPIGNNLVFERHAQRQHAVVMNHGWDGTLSVQLTNGSSKERRVLASEIVSGLALQDAVAVVSSAKNELNRVLQVEYPQGVGVAFVKGSRREHGVVLEHEGDGTLTVRLTSDKRKTKRIAAHQIRA